MKRYLDTRIKQHFDKYDQALILLGARQVGKTTILKKLFPTANYLLIDEKPIQDILETYSISAYKQILGDSKEIILDELHLLSDPGRAVKIIYDQVDGIKIMVTGSSSLNIKNKTGESMAGRSINYSMYPLAFAEYLVQTGSVKELDGRILDRIIEQSQEESFYKFDKKNVLENILLYGLYPNTINIPEDRDYLKNLATNAVFKDILALDLIDNRAKAQELLKLLAYQIGNLISYTEIGNKIGLNSQTVQRYIEIFEQSFIIYRLYPFSKNKRNEIGKMPKVYFWDLGLRNALIDNFDPIRIRPDLGAMFENFIITEVKKLISYTSSDYKVNYWRLKTGAEVDLVLSNNSELIGCEVKFNDGKVTPAFTNRYPQAKTHLINSGNFY